ncbi:MAG: cobalt ECF transporter T component CbiQ [Actinobacteria bacterium]|nr:cobalt ECF transporter T component CbiQ [Actinomycetota bacterium]
MSNILNIRNKLIITLVNIFFIVSVVKGRYLIFAFYFLATIIVVFLFKPDFKQLVKRVSLVFLYPFFISIFIPFANEGAALAKIDLKVFTLAVTDNGLTIFAAVLIKSFLSILLLTSLIVSTDEIELLHGLRKIHLPKVIVSIIFLMYRYIFLITEESRTGQQAIKSRVFQKSYHTVNKRLTHVIGNLFIKSLDRAENVYRSMESRGFDGNFYIVEKENTKGSLNIALLLIFILTPASIKVIEMASII